MYKNRLWIVSSNDKWPVNSFNNTTWPIKMSWAKSKLSLDTILSSFTDFIRKTAEHY